ncbi:MAG: ABC transporter substrate-binding protein [Suipraeoptans sp.]
MKSFKRIASLLIVVSLMMTMVAACGGNNDSSDSDSGSDSESADTFKIGGIGPITGDAATYGIAVKNGAEIAVKEINEAGGINGKEIEFKFEDDVHDAEKSVNAYNTLKDWGMQMLMGTVTSTPCIAVQAEASDDNMFLITPSGTAVDCISGDNAFRLCFSDPEQGTKSAEYIGENKIATKVAAIYDSSDAYSKGIYDNFAKEAESQGIDIVSAEAFTADSNKDFSVQLQKAQDAGAELVFLPIYYTEASLILKQASDMDYAPTFFGCDGLDGILSMDGFDTSLAEGTMLLTPFDANAEDEQTQDFVTAYKDAYDGAVPIQFAADAYDAIYAIKAAAEDAKVTTDMNVSDICDALSPSMLNIEVKGLTGDIRWQEGGEPNKEPKAVIIEDGVYKMM